MAALPGAGGMGLLVGGAVRGLLWSAAALVTGLDLDVFVSLVGSPRCSVYNTDWRSFRQGITLLTRVDEC